MGGSIQTVGGTTAPADAGCGRAVVGGASPIPSRELAVPLQEAGADGRRGRRRVKRRACRVLASVGGAGLELATSVGDSSACGRR